MLKKIFWPEMEEVRGDWRQLFEEEIYDFSSSKNIIQVIKYVECSGGDKWPTWGRVKYIQNFGGEV
jgi:hypothetical protein